MVFMDHCEIKHMSKKHQLFLVLDGATSLLWGATQQEGIEPVTQDLFREWMHVHSCKPKWLVADMAFFTPSWMTFWKTHGDADRKSHSLAKSSRDSRRYEKLLMDASAHPALREVTLRDLIQETVSGYTPVELATGRRPTDHSDLELMKPDQLSAVRLLRSWRSWHLELILKLASIWLDESFLLMDLMLMETESSGLMTRPRTRQWVAGLVLESYHRMEPL